MNSSESSAVTYSHTAVAAIAIATATVQTRRRSPRLRTCLLEMSFIFRRPTAVSRFREGEESVSGRITSLDEPSWNRLEALAFEQQDEGFEGVEVARFSVVGSETLAGANVEHVVGEPHQMAQGIVADVVVTNDELPLTGKRAMKRADKGWSPL